MSDQKPQATETPTGAASALSAGLGIPTDAEILANQMQFGADMVTKYSNVCRALKQECRDADELLKLLRLDPEIYRTEGGYINVPKVKAALANPNDYPMMPNALGEGREPASPAKRPLERLVGGAE